MDSKAAQQCNICPYVYAVYWLRSASSTFYWPGNAIETMLDKMRNATCADTQTLIEFLLFVTYVYLW